MDLYSSPLAPLRPASRCMKPARGQLSRGRSKTKVVQNDARTSGRSTAWPVPTLPPTTDRAHRNAAILQYVADRFPQAGIYGPA